MYRLFNRKRTVDVTRALMTKSCAHGLTPPRAIPVEHAGLPYYTGHDIGPSQIRRNGAYTAALEVQLQQQCCDGSGPRPQQCALVTVAAAPKPSPARSNKCPKRASAETKRGCRRELERQRRDGRCRVGDVDGRRGRNGVVGR